MRALGVNLAVFSIAQEYGVHSIAIQSNKTSKYMLLIGTKYLLEVARCQAFEAGKATGQSGVKKGEAGTLAESVLAYTQNSNVPQLLC